MSQDPTSGPARGEGGSGQPPGLDGGVTDALLRSLAHASYHVGQIVYAAKAARGADWTYLSIPPGQSEQYNRQPTLDRPPAR